MDMWSTGCIALELWVLRPLVSHGLRGSPEVFWNIIKQITMGEGSEYLTQLPLWSDALFKPLARYHLHSRMEAAGMPADEKAFFVKVLTMHPDRRLKIGAARQEWSAMSRR